MLKDLVNQVFKHAAEEAPRECCGLIVDDNQYIKMKNISTDKDSFKMDDKVFTLLQLQRKILYVVHSHYEEDSKPSQYDINNCNATKIPFLIVSYPEKEYSIIKPC